VFIRVGRRLCVRCGVRQGWRRRVGRHRRGRGRGRGLRCICQTVQLTELAREVGAAFAAPVRQRAAPGATPGHAAMRSGWRHVPRRPVGDVRQSRGQGGFVQAGRRDDRATLTTTTPRGLRRVPDRRAPRVASLPGGAGAGGVLALAAVEGRRALAVPVPFNRVAARWESRARTQAAAAVAHLVDG